MASLQSHAAPHGGRMGGRIVLVFRMLTCGCSLRQARYAVAHDTDWHAPRGGPAFGCHRYAMRIVQYSTGRRFSACPGLSESPAREGAAPGRRRRAGEAPVSRRSYVEQLRLDFFLPGVVECQLSFRGVSGVTEYPGLVLISNPISLHRCPLQGKEAAIEWR